MTVHSLKNLFMLILIVYRLAYAVWLLHELCEKYSSGVKLYVMYDIACKLVQNLQV